MIKSNQLKWKLEQEWFAFLNASWDVRMAKMFLAAKPREIKQLNLEGTKRWEALIGTGRAAHRIDLSFPVIILTLHDGQQLPIDGWKRIKKALKQGLTTLPCLVLNKLESRKIRVR